MGFINERIPEEEKKKFTFPVKTYPDGSKPTLSKWTIDRERDAFLVLTRAGGGGYQGTPRINFYILSWKGNLIEIEATRLLGVKETENGPIISWKVHKLKIPSSLSNQRDQVKALIQEAFTAMGVTHKSGEVFAVNLDLPDSI